MTAQEIYDDLARRTHAILQTITIYVRKGDHAKERLISFNPIPTAADALPLVDAGFAVDGNSATFSVDRYIVVYHHHGENARNMLGLTFPGDEPHVVSFHRLAEGSDTPQTLTRAVHDVEKAIADWLRALGYTVKFG